jgi:hypothetical protein
MTRFDALRLLKALSLSKGNDDGAWAFLVFESESSEGRERAN